MTTTKISAKDKTKAGLTFFAHGFFYIHVYMYESY